MLKLLVSFFVLGTLATPVYAAEDIGQMPMLKISSMITGFMPDNNEVWFKALLIHTPKRENLGLMIAVGHPKNGFQESLRNGDLRLPIPTADGSAFTAMSIDQETGELNIETFSSNEFGSEQKRRILQIGFYETQWFVNAVKIENTSAGKTESCSYDLVEKKGVLNGQVHPPTKDPVALATFKDSDQTLGCEGW